MFVAHLCSYLYEVPLPFLCKAEAKLTIGSDTKGCDMASGSCVRACRSKCVAPNHSQHDHIQVVNMFACMQDERTPLQADTCTARNALHTCSQIDQNIV